MGGGGVENCPFCLIMILGPFPFLARDMPIIVNVRVQRKACAKKRNQRTFPGHSGESKLGVLDPRGAASQNFAFPDLWPLEGADSPAHAAVHTPGTHKHTPRRPAGGRVQAGGRAGPSGRRRSSLGGPPGLAGTKLGLGGRGHAAGRAVIGRPGSRAHADWPRGQRPARPSRPKPEPRSLCRETRPPCTICAGGGVRRG